jgi:hypothetical protein
MKRTDNSSISSFGSIDFNSYPFAFETPEEKEACSIVHEISENDKMMFAIKGIVIFVSLTAFCVVGLTCSYRELS